MPIARYYQDDRNPTGSSFPSVPLADIDDELWDSYPAWLQRSVDAWANDTGAKVYLKTRRVAPTVPALDVVPVSTGTSTPEPAPSETVTPAPEIVPDPAPQGGS